MTNDNVVKKYFDSLEMKLSEEGVRERWWRHIKTLNHKGSREKFKTLVQDLGNGLGDTKIPRELFVCISLAQVCGEEFDIRVQGRKVARIRSHKSGELGWTGATEEAGGSRIGSPHWKPIKETREEFLRTLSRKLPPKAEAKLQQWLVEKLNPKRKQQKIAPFDSKRAVDYEGAFLQFSVPIPASGSWFTSVGKLADGISRRDSAFGHTDVLARFGLGSNSELAILELKVGKGPNKDVAGALRQAFEYAYCYRWACANASERMVKDLRECLGYGHGNRQSLPSIRAIAVVPLGSRQNVVAEACRAGVRPRKAEPENKLPSISLWVWEYAEDQNGEDYSFQKEKCVDNDFAETKPLK